MFPAVCCLSRGLRGVSLKLMLKPIKNMNVASNDASHLGELSPAIGRHHGCSGPLVARIVKATWRSAGLYLLLCWETKDKVTWKGCWLSGAHQLCHLVTRPARLPPSCKVQPQLLGLADGRHLSLGSQCLRPVNYWSSQYPLCQASELPMKHGELLYQLSRKGFSALPLVICKVVVLSKNLSSQKW